MAAATSTVRQRSMRARGAMPEVLERIRGLIAEEGLVPGMKLPAERQMAARLRVGRPAVREAIKALSMLGLVESRWRDGTYVRSAGIEYRRLPGRGEPESPYDLIELLEVRRMIEPRAASLAASRAGERELRAIEAELLAQEAAPEDFRVLERHDYRFHEAIVRAAGNRVVCDIHRTLAAPLRKSRELTAHTTPDVPRIVGQHRAIFDSIRTRQPELAEKAMMNHLVTVALDLISERRR